MSIKDVALEGLLLTLGTVHLTDACFVSIAVLSQRALTSVTCVEHITHTILYKVSIKGTR